MALAYGYNVKKAEELIGNISSSYKNFGSKIKSEWEAVVTTLQTEWIGVDEQDFEKKFAKRVCDMYETAHSLVENSIKNVVELTNKWIDFQNRNSLDGETIGSVKKMSGDFSVTKLPELISYKARSFSDTDDMGLANENSAGKVSGVVKDFARNLQKEARNLFESIETSSAFFGGQSKDLKKYIEAVGGTLGEITVAVKDLDDALEKLAKSNYKTSNENIETSMKTAVTEVEKLSDQLGETRWK